MSGLKGSDSNIKPLPSTHFLNIYLKKTLHSGDSWPTDNSLIIMLFVEKGTTKRGKTPKETTQRDHHTKTMTTPLPSRKE